MARVTVEDCVEVVQNRFELVAVATQRARKIASGAPITVSRDNDKDAVVALRELAEKTVSVDNLKENLIQSCQKRVKVDEYGVEDFIEEKEGSDGLASEAAAEARSFQEDENGNTSQNESNFADENLDVDD